jgi:cellulose synthase (UDP-forming)
LGAYHFSRKNLHQYQTEDGVYKARTKYGNYNAWLSEIGFRKYEIFTSFDPDHVPDLSFLENVIGYFSDPSVAYVQAAQAYYNQDASFIARGAAEETYAYYSSTQMSIYSMDFPIVVGCHNTHRMSSLEQVGGFAPHDGDDLLITLLYRNAGWQGVYLPMILAKGLTPVDWSGYLTQQLRWVQSVLDIKIRAFPKMAGNLPFKTRLMGLLHGLYYVQEGLSNFVALSLMAFMLATGITPKFLSYLTMKKVIVLIAVLQFLDFYRQRFFLDWRREWGFHWRARLLRLAKWPYIFIGFVYALTNRKRPYALTLKVKTEAKRYMLICPHLLIAITLTVAWLAGMLFGHVLHPLLQAWTALIVMLSIGFIWTETWDFPEPYDEKLWVEMSSIKEKRNKKIHYFTPHKTENLNIRQ